MGHVLRVKSLLVVGLMLGLALPAAPARAVTVSEPYLVRDLHDEGDITHMTGVEDTLFFTTDDEDGLLWKTDGTPAGTVPVAELVDQSFEDPVAFGGLLVFEGYGGLWRSDGTTSGTRFIAPVRPNGEDRRWSPTMLVADGTLFVDGRGPNGTVGLWRSDATPGGTTLVTQGFGGEIALFRGGVIGGNGFWTSDGTAEGIRRFGSTGLPSLRVVGDDLLLFTRFAPYTAIGVGLEEIQLWRTDGTDEGTFPIAVLGITRREEDTWHGYAFPTVLPSAVDSGRFVVCASGGVWSSDGTTEGTQRLATRGCYKDTVRQKVGGVWLFNTSRELWRSDGTLEGTRPLAPADVVLGATDEVVVFASGTELWQSDGTEAGTFAVSPMPRVGWHETSGDILLPLTATAGDTVFFCGCTGSLRQCSSGNGCGLWAVAIPTPSTTTTTTSTSTTSTTLPPLDPPVGTVLADVSVLKKKSRSALGHKELLWVDRKSPKYTFIRVQVAGLGDQPAEVAILRLHVAETRYAPSKAAGRIHLMDECSWDEDAVTWKTRPAFASDPLDTQERRVVRGETVDFDVTKAIAGDGVYCFAIDSRSSDGVEYYSREAEGGGPELLLSPPDPAIRMGAVVADTSVLEAAPDRNFGQSPSLWADRRSIKRTFFRVEVGDSAGHSVRDMRLRLRVDDKRSAGGPAGRLYQVTDCSWSELDLTYRAQPDIDGPLLDEPDTIVEPGGIIEFDITPAITGDGSYCFALEGSSRNGVIYRSREAALGGPVIVTTTSP